MEAQTLGQLFLRSVAYRKPDHLLVESSGEYRPVSSEEFYRRVARLHHYLRGQGLRKGDRCGLLSENRWEWAAADFAMMTAGIVSVPLYPTLPAEQIHYMLDDSGARGVFVSTPVQRQKIDAIRGRLPALETVMGFDEGPRLFDGPLSEQERREFEAAIGSLRPEDLASIIYTSGTTGAPKGVMLTHGNLTSNVRDAAADFSPEDVAISFLPLCHIYERTIDYCYYWHGVTVAHIDSLEKVPESLARIRPTVLAAVPRFYEKIHGRLMDAVAAAPPLRRKLFYWAAGIGRRSTPYRLEGRPMPWRLRLQFALADRLVFSQLRARLGGRIRRLASGGAPLARELSEFFYAIHLPITEGYGLTETSPLVAVNRPEALRFGTVGKPIRNVEVKIAEDGEILVRGPNVMRGYYKMERETAEALRDGWLHTGDIGTIDAAGFLTVIDRKKDLLKTAGGKYIAPQPIENRLKSSPYIADAVVIADRRRFPSALIVPNFERLERFAAGRGIARRPRSELVRHPVVVQLIEEEAAKACEGLARFEQIKKVAILDQEFSIAAGEITPTMKVRRREVEQRYREVIDRIYEEAAV
jgi:long-chain acyl-CoA synthetase